jgi:hypothetical protein
MKTNAPSYSAEINHFDEFSQIELGSVSARSITPPSYDVGDSSRVSLSSTHSLARMAPAVPQEALAQPAQPAVVVPGPRKIAHLPLKLALGVVVTGIGVGGGLAAAAMASSLMEPGGGMAPPDWQSNPNWQSGELFSQTFPYNAKIAAPVVGGAALGAYLLFLLMRKSSSRQNVQTNA